MKKTVLLAATIFGLTAVILGAFGAHAFKQMLEPEKLLSFETGVKYQMYSALLLLILGLNFNFKNSFEKNAAGCVMIGTLLFSVSIYFLTFSDFWGIDLKWLGPITPLGGLLMIIGWALLFWSFLKSDKINKISV